MEVMGDIILSKIIAEVRISGFFAVEANEVMDRSNWEQLGIAVHYILNGTFKERLLSYAQCKSISSEDIYQKLVEVFTSADLDLQLCRAQAYDGAGNMAGHMKGCQALFHNAYPLAKYFHCANHQLNLALNHSCQQKEVHIMLENLKGVGLFFQYSPKRQRQLEEEITDLNEGHRSAENKKR